MENADSNTRASHSFSSNREAALQYNDSGLRKYLRVDFDDAIADYTRALECDPGLAAAYFNRGTVLYRLGDYRAALRDLAKAADLEPRNADFSEGLGECRRRCQDAGVSPAFGNL